MKTYELIYLIPSTYSEDQLAGVQKQVEEVFKKEKAEILYHKVWRRSKLAYKIKQVEHAYYILVYFNTDSNSVVNINRYLSLMRDIVRERIFICEDLKRQVKYFIEEHKEEEIKKQMPIQEAVRKEAEVKPSKRVPVTPKIKQEDVLEEDHKEEKEKKEKASLEDLDKRLEDLLEGEIEL